MAVEYLLPWSLCQSSTSGHLSWPSGMRKHGRALKNAAWDDAMSEFEGARDGVAADGRKAKEEVRKDFSTSAKSSISSTIGLEVLNVRVSKRCA